MASPDALVELAGKGAQGELQKALDGAETGAVAAIRYGPAKNGLAHAAAANTKNPQAVAQVAAAGSDVNLVDANGRTPLHFAIEMNAEAALLQLIAAGADPSIETGLGPSAMTFCEDALQQVPDYQICLTLLRKVR